MTYSTVETAVESFNKIGDDNRTKNYAEIHNLRNHYLNEISRIVVSRTTYRTPRSWYLKLTEAACRLIEIEYAYEALAEQARRDGTFNTTIK